MRIERMYCVADAVLSVLIDRVQITEHNLDV